MIINNLELRTTKAQTPNPGLKLLNEQRCSFKKKKKIWYPENPFKWKNDLRRKLQEWLSYQNLIRFSQDTYN